DSTGSAAELAARLEAAADAMLTEVAGLSSGLVDWKPAEDVWSIMEILCHVSEFVPYWTSQALQIMRRPDDPWWRDHTNTARLDAVRQGESRPLSEVLAEIHAGVQHSAAEIRGSRDADLAIEAMSRNPRWARKPASFIVDHLLVEHVEKHLGQI